MSASIAFDPQIFTKGKREMASFNKVILMGNLTRDVELKYTTSGTAVAEVGVAVNRVWKDKSSGEKKEDCTFVDCTLWGRTAEILNEYCGKGSPVHFEGRLQLDQWEDRETGGKRSKLKVIVESLQLLPNARQQQQSAAAPESRGESSGEAFQPSPLTDSDEYVPF